MSTSKVPLCDPYVCEDPRFLFRTTWLDRYRTTQRGVCFSELINEIVFVYLFALLCGAVASAFLNVPSAPVFAGMAATVYLIPVFFKLRDVDGFRIRFIGSDSMGKEDPEPSKLLQQEGFKNCQAPITRDKGGAISGLPESTEGFTPAPVNLNDVGVELNPLTTTFQNETSPCVKNPFHNVLIDEIKYAPTREAAPDITTTDRKVALDDFFRVQWYSDPTDVFGKSQSQRQFITQPSTTIPNDQGSYQDWLYKIPGKTCKEGGAENCYGGTNGGQLPWVNL